MDDMLGLELAAPDEGWRERPDMAPFTTRFRAAIVARGRFVEDLVVEQAARGVGQYVILGAGLDTFAQRRPEVASKLRVFEVDQPGPQAWKRQRLMELGYGVPDYLRLVPVNFEAGSNWWDELAAAGFDATQPAVVVSTGVTMYITREALAATLRQVAKLAPGSTLATTFLVPLEMVDAEDQTGTRIAIQGAAASGTPFISFYSPEDIVALARECGLPKVRYVSTADIIERYFAGRTDGLRPSNGEQFIVATV